MPHRDYSHQDLRNRSFKNQDLTDADFSYSDLRGCNFASTTLTRANFQHCRTGQSRKQITTRVAVAVAVAGAVAGAVAVAGTAITAFSRGAILEGVVYSLLALVLFGFAIYSFLEVVKTIRNATGTDFSQADLGYANFSHAIVCKTDFSGETILDWVNWTGVKFFRCSFPRNFEDVSVISLCTDRDGRGQDYRHGSLKNLDLRGVNLADASLISANLNGANLHHANLVNADLSNAQALRTDFSKANLTGACIQNWGINSDTQFTHVRCDYIYLEIEQGERKPASGSFQPGDFEKLAHQFTKTLDFLFRNGIEPEAFDFALKNLLINYEDAGLSMDSVINVGDGDRLVRFKVANPNADKEAMHSQVTQDYELMRQQLTAAEAEKAALREDLADIKGQLMVHRENSVFMQRFVYHQTEQFSRPTFHAPNSHFSGDPMADKGNKVEIGSIGGDASGISGGDNSGVAGKNITGAAGGDVSGTLAIALDQLSDSQDPKVLELADLLKQMETAIEKDAGLSESDRAKASKHLEAIAHLGSDRTNSDLLEKAGDALDALPTIIKRGNNLAEFAEKYLPTFTAGVKAIFAFWGVSL